MQGGDVNINYAPSFFTADANIREWAKYKPFKYPKNFNVTDNERSSRNWGLSNVPYWDNVNYMADYVRNGSPLAGNCGTPYFAYIPPVGGTSEPLRLEDFRGYYTEAVQPYLPYNDSVMMADSTTAFSITVPVNVQPSQQYNLTLADLHYINSGGNVVGDWRNSYLCLGLLKIGSTEFYMATGNASVADDPTIGNYPGNAIFVFDRVRHAAGKYKSFLFVSSVKDVGSSTADLDVMAYADLFDYTLIDDEKEIVRVGTNAHYWLDKLPQVVTKDNDEYLSLNYGVLGTVCALSVSKYVKQLEDRVTLLENKIASL